jgi:hypothetical protein
MEASMDNHQPAEFHPDERKTTHKILADIHEQGRQTFALVKALVDLITPKGERDGPTLEELLAKIMNQQMHVIMIGNTILSDLDRLGKTLPEAVVEAIEEPCVLRS